MESGSFSLDYMPFLVGIAINLFGAITFGRQMQHYPLGGDAYGTVVAH